MTPPLNYSQLRRFEARAAVVTTTEGEVLRALVDSVFDEEQDLSYLVLATNQPDRYGGSAPGAWHVIPWPYILEIVEMRAGDALNAALGPDRQPLLARCGPRAGQQIGWVRADGTIQGRFAPDGGVVFRTGGK